jgi:hypothetical protein
VSGGWIPVWSLEQSFFPAMTKIVGTLGPKSRSVDTISACLKAGMSGNCLCLSLCRSQARDGAVELICYLVWFGLVSSSDDDCSRAVRFLVGGRRVPPGDAGEPQARHQVHQEALRCKLTLLSVFFFYKKKKKL